MNSTEEFSNTGDEQGPDWYIDPFDDKTWARTVLLIIVALLIIFGWNWFYPGATRKNTHCARTEISWQKGPDA